MDVDGHPRHPESPSRSRSTPAKTGRRRYTGKASLPMAIYQLYRIGSGVIRDTTDRVVPWRAIHVKTSSDITSAVKMDHAPVWTVGSASSVTSVSDVELIYQGRIKLPIKRSVDKTINV